jgi:uncharacterized protein YbjT (DUF2867 family)
MRQTSARVYRVLLCVVITSLFVACAKEDVSPVDLEKKAFEDLRTDIREAIAEPAREAEVIRLVGILEQDFAELRARITARESRAAELNANYDIPRAEFEAFLAEVEAEVRDNKQRVSKTHQELLSIATPDERAAITKTRTKAMKAIVRSIQSI